MMHRLTGAVTSALCSDENVCLIRFCLRLCLYYVCSCD